MNISTRHAGAALALAGALVLGACGSSDSTDSSGSPSSSSSTKGTDSSTLTKGSTVDAGDVVGRMVAALEKAGSGSMTMGGGAQKGSGDFRYVDGTMEQHTTIAMEGQSMEVISLGDFVYLKGLPGQPKPWVKIDPKASDPVSQMFKGLVEGGVNDPATMAKRLKGTDATVTDVKDGATTYEITVDPAKLLAGSGAPTPTASASASASAPPMTVTYVLDDQDRPVRVTAGAPGQGLDVTYGEWGKKVDITEPPADQVGPMTMPSAG